MIGSDKIIMVLIVGALVLGGVAYLMNKGGDIERAKIEKENASASTRADEFERNLRDCLDAGGVFNHGSGKCTGAESSRWWVPPWR